MKNKNKFLLLLTFTSILSLVACQENTVSADEVSATVGVISVTATSSTDPSSSDAIKTIRFIVFDYASSRPTLEVNELKDVTGASEISVTLGVTKHATNDKLLVTIANEPASMTLALNALNGTTGTTAYSTLTSLKVNFLQFWDNDLQTFLSDVKMPMTAAVWTDMVYANQQEAELNSVPVSLQRVAARVDVYAVAEGEGEEILKEGSELILRNNYEVGNLVHAEMPQMTVGTVPTISPSDLFITPYTITNDQTISNDPNKPTYICSFYTPERTCIGSDNSDKLFLEVNFNVEGTKATGELVYDKVKGTDGNEEDLTMITRNYLYKTLLTIRKSEITGEIVKYTDVEQNVILDAQYKLEFSQSEAQFDCLGGDIVVEVETDYDASVNQGLSGGLSLGDVIYETGSGWVNATLSPSSGSTPATLTITANKVTCSENLTEERVAKVYVQAGNLKNFITIRQTPIDIAIYVGMFGGEFAKDPNTGVWAYSKPLYVQPCDILTGVTWAEKAYLTSKTNVTDFYEGKKNTYELYQLDPDDFLPVKACFELNSNFSAISGTGDSDFVWYLPAVRQLIAVWVSHNALEDSYPLRQTNYDPYWSSTESSATLAYPVIFSYRAHYLTAGYSGTFLKDNKSNYKVRCVKDGF